MKKDIKEQLEKLQYYGEFYAKSDIDDKIKLEELDKSGEISEFGRNFSPQVDHKYTMVISDRRSYLLGNGRGGKDFENFLTTLEKLDNEKYLGLRESLETDPARYHIYTHRGDLLEAFDGIYDEELEKIGTNFGEVYKEVNETIKRGEVDLTDYPDLERAFSDYELKLLDKEIWERDNNYVKFYMDNAYEYLNEKNVLLEEAKMLDVEKHKNVGADMKTINDGSLLDGLSENVSIPESEKVARGLDKEAVDERKLYEIQEKIIENIKNNDNYKEYSCYKVNEYYSSYGLENEHGRVVVPPYSVALTSKEEPDLYGVSDYPDVNIIPSLEDNGEINLNLKISEGIAQEFRLSDLFNDIETDDIYENAQDFASFKKVDNESKVTLDNDCDYRHEITITSMQYTYEDYHHPEINETFQEVYVNDIAETNVKLDMNELSTKDFLKEPLDTFNEYSKSKKYNDILKEGRDSYLDVKDMLIEEGVIDKNRYDELLEEKAEFDKTEEIARKNIEKIMGDEEFVNSIMDSDDKYILKQVYFVNKNEFSTMDFIDDGFDDTYIKFSDGEKVLVGPNVNNAEEDLAKFTAQAKLYGEFSRNNKYKDYKVNLDSDYGVRLSDMTKPYSDLVLIRPDEYNKDTGNFDMRFKLSDTKFILMNDYELLSSIATDNMNDVKRNFIEDVQLRDEVNYEVEGLGKVEHETWKIFQSIDSGVTNVDNDHYEFELNDTLEFNKCVHIDDIHKLDYLDDTVKKFNQHSFVAENIEYLDKNVHDSEEMLKFMVNNDMLDQAKYEQKVEDYKEYRFEKIIDSLSNKKQDNTLEM